MELTADLIDHLKQAEFKILCRFDEICNMAEAQYYLTAGSLLGAVRHQGFIPWDDDIDLLMFNDQYDKLRKWWKQHNPDGLFLQDPYSDSKWSYPFAKVRLLNSVFLENAYHKRPRHCEIFIDIFIVYPYEERLAHRFWAKQQLLYAQMERNITGYSSLREYLSLMRHSKNLRPGKANAKLIKLLKSSIVPRQKTNTALYLSFCPLVFPCRPFDETVYLPFEGRSFPAPKDWDTVLKNQYGDYMKLPPIEERIAHHSVREIDFGPY